MYIYFKKLSTSLKIVSLHFNVKQSKHLNKRQIYCLKKNKNYDTND